MEIIRRPKGADILDYHVHADAMGRLKVAVECRAVFPAPIDDRRKIITRLYTDEQLTPDGSGWKQGEQIWTSEKAVTNDKTNTVLGIKLQSPKLWTAETPHLYSLTVALLDGDKEVQVESCRVGFRTVEISDGLVKVNGKKITVCGVNRHEHDPDNGKVITHDSMKLDISLLKYVKTAAVATVHLFERLTIPCRSGIGKTISTQLEPPTTQTTPPSTATATTTGFMCAMKPTWRRTDSSQLAILLKTQAGRTRMSPASPGMISLDCAELMLNFSCSNRSFFVSREPKTCTERSQSPLCHLLVLGK